MTRLGDRIDSVDTRVLDEIKQVIDHDRRRRRLGDQLFEAVEPGASEKLAQANDGEALRAVIEHLVQGAKEMESQQQEARSEPVGLASRKSSSSSKISRPCASKASPIR